MTEKKVGEALKRMKKGMSSGPNEVSCEIFSNEMCVKELWNSKWPVDARDYVSHGRRAQLFPCIKVREVCWSVATTTQSSCWSMGCRWDEGSDEDI